MPTTYAIPNGAKVMDATLYTGNAGSITVNNAGSFKPDLIWIKARSSAYDNKLVDSVRGSSGGIYYDLSSNSTGAESLPGAGVNGITSTGFTIGGGTNNGYNGNGTTFVAWQWQAGQGSNTTNTSGTITSTVSANVTAGFSIVTYTGTGSTGTVGHGLGVAPQMIIEKRRNAATNWFVYFPQIGSGGTFFEGLNTTAAGTSPSTSQITANASTITIVNATDHGASGGTYVDYCWAEVAGFSKFGSYTGNGSADGPFVYTGFRPKFVMIKRTDGADHWTIQDTSRDPYNVSGLRLYPDQSAAEDTSPAPTAYMDMLSNGFKIRTSDGQKNASGGAYVYACFAENPFKYANAR